jgi:ABC-type Na+ efflux pump permease subunit
MNSKTVLVAQRELMENFRTKAFWIGILFFPFLISLSILVPIWVEQTKEARRYAVVDRSGWLLEAVEERAMTPDLEKVFTTALERYREGGEAFDELPEALRQTAIRLDEGISFLGKQPIPGIDADRTFESQLVLSFATLLTNLSGPEGEKLRQMVPEEAAERLLEIRESVRIWWSELPPEEAEKYGARTKGRYIRAELDLSLDEEALLEELNRKVVEQELFGYFVVGEDPVKGEGELKYVSANLTDDDLLRWFSRLATDAVRERRLAEKKIAKEVAAWIQEPLRFTAMTVGKEGAEEEVDTQDKIRHFAPVAFVYLLWFAVFMNAQMLLTNTVEEKSNRIMEVLLSSVSPSQLMAGKIAGIAATGLMVVGSWAVFFYLAVKYIPRLVSENPPFDLSVIATDPFYMGSFLLYFFLGYLFLSAVLVGIGSVCNSLKEAQNMMMPVTLMTIVPLLLMVPIAEDPNSMLAKTLSYFPPFTPFVMMNRAAAPPTAFEYVATTILMVASIVFVQWAAAKVFRIGILMTGKPPKIAEILKWIRAPVGAVPERRE